VTAPDSPGFAGHPSPTPSPTHNARYIGWSGRGAVGDVVQKPVVVYCPPEALLPAVAGCPSAASDVSSMTRRWPDLESS